MSIKVLYYPENSPYLDLALKNPFFKGVTFQAYHPEEPLEAEYFFLFNLLWQKGLDEKEEFIDVSRIWGTYLRQKQSNIKLVTLNTLPPASLGTKHHLNLMELPTGKNLLAFLEEVPFVAPEIEALKDYATDFFEILHGFYVRHDYKQFGILSILENAFEKMIDPHLNFHHTVADNLPKWEVFKARFSKYHNIIDLLPYQKHVDKINQLIPLIDTYLTDLNSLAINKYGSTTLFKELKQPFDEIGYQTGILTKDRNLSQTSIQSGYNAPNLSILVIDDDEDDQNIIKNQLEPQKSFNIDFRSTFKEGFDLLKVKKYDIVLLDLVLDLKRPTEFLGIGHIKDLRREFPTLKIIAMSGVFTPSAEEEVKKLKVDGIVDKYLEKNLVQICIDVYQNQKRFEENKEWIKLPNNELVYLGIGPERQLWNRDLNDLARTTEHALIYGGRGSGRMTAINYIFYKSANFTPNKEHFIEIPINSYTQPILDLLYNNEKLRSYKKAPASSIQKATTCVDYNTYKTEHMEILEEICKKNRLISSKMEQIELNSQFLIKIKQDVFNELKEKNIGSSFRKQLWMHPLNIRTKEQKEALLLFWIFKESKEMIKPEDSFEVLHDERVAKLIEEYDWSGNMYDMSDLACKIKVNYDEKGNFRDFDLPEQMKFLANEKKKTIKQSIGSSTLTSESAVKEVYFLGLSPKGQKPIDVSLEEQEIKDALSSSGIEVNSEFNRTWKTVQKNILNSKAQIIHIAAHGVENGLYFSDGEKQFGNTFSLIFKDPFFRQHVRCIVLNACHSSEQARNLSQYGLYVIGMYGKVDDTIAIKFAEGFYTSTKALKENQFESAFHVGLVLVKESLSQKQIWRDIDDDFDPKEHFSIQLWFNGEKIDSSKEA